MFPASAYSIRLIGYKFATREKWKGRKRGGVLEAEPKARESGAGRKSADQVTHTWNHFYKSLDVNESVFWKAISMMKQMRQADIHQLFPS